jgi:hypothetical protein
MRKLLRKRVVIAAVAAMALSGTALAAWIIYSGVDGSGNGTLATSTTNKAVTVTVTGSTPLAPGTTTQLAASALNNDASASHTIQTLTGTFTANPSSCAQYLALKTGSDLIGVSIAAGATRTGQVPIELNGSAPVSCAGATWSVTFGGSTS